jgi:hypothetical protein
MPNRNFIKAAVLLVIIGFQMVVFCKDKRFKLELSSNLLFASPDHFNTLPETEQQFLSFYFDPVYDSANTRGSFNSIHSLFSVNTRLNYVLSSKFYLSVGFSYLWRNQISKNHITYTRDDDWRIVTDVLDYPEMVMQVRALIPALGIHYSLPVSSKVTIIGSLTGGPVFASLNYSNEVIQTITSDFGDSTFPFWNSEKSLTMEGQGTGISLTGNIRLEQDFSRSLGIAIEGGYAWQRVGKISGDGSMTIDGIRTDFSGEWGLVKEDILTAWGEIQLIFPTNNWDEFGQTSEDFILDLSGFYINIGVYLRL